MLLQPEEHAAHEFLVQTLASLALVELQPPQAVRGDVGHPAESNLPDAQHRMLPGLHEHLGSGVEEAGEEIHGQGLHLD